MKINSKIVAGVCFTVGVLLGSISFAKSDVVAQKIAIVDVPTIVAQSAQVKSLKNEQAKQNKELQKWLESANADVQKQTTDVNKQKLVKKYNEEFAKKKEANKKAYLQKLSAIDKSISETIATQAKLKGYDVVLSKSAVLYGGDDITSEIAKIVK